MGDCSELVAFNRIVRWVIETTSERGRIVFPSWLSSPVSLGSRPMEPHRDELRRKTEQSWHYAAKGVARPVQTPEASWMVLKRSVRALLRPLRSNHL